MKWLVTGGAGFIGCNVVRRLLTDSHEVVVLDDLSRRGARENLAWLQSQGKFAFLHQDIRDAAGVQQTIARHRDTQVVLHLAGQVAVTTSVADPRADFEINAGGTLNLLEAVRRSAPEAVFLYASTNKVYGSMEHESVELVDGRYAYKHLEQGVSETAPLDFHSPYGCSKGAADQYVRDYSRIYGLPTVVFRQSCIYGERQFGIEDQGWVGWFTIAALLGRRFTIFGDGRQVRDVLFVDDLAECYLRAVEAIDCTAGEIYNVGGGSDNQLSLLELVDVLSARTGRKLDPPLADWRPADQKIFVCDVSKALKDFGWAPKISTTEGVERLASWVEKEKAVLQAVLA